MTSDLVTPAQIALYACITEKHARRVIRQFSAGPYQGRQVWRGAALRIGPGLMVEFASLPADVRDAALVMRDQLSLPLPPPERNKLERRAAPDVMDRDYGKD